MSETLLIRAELLKLARLLDAEEAELAFLGDELSCTELRELRELATERIFAVGGPRTPSRR